MTKLDKLNQAIADKQSEAGRKKAAFQIADAEYRRESERIRAIRDTAENEYSAVMGELDALNKEVVKLKASTFKFNATTDMWDIVAQLGWGTRTTDCEFLGEVLKKLNKKKRTEFITFVAQRRHEIDRKITNVVDVLSDDGFDDLCWHIVGLGKETFDKVMKTPKLAQTMYDNDEYKESFAYCLHSINGIS